MKTTRLTYALSLLLLFGCSGKKNDTAQVAKKHKEATETILATKGTATGADFSGNYALEMTGGKIDCRRRAHSSPDKGFADSKLALQCQQNAGSFLCRGDNQIEYKGFLHQNGEFGLTGPPPVSEDSKITYSGDANITGQFTNPTTAKGEFAVPVPSGQTNQKVQCHLVYSVTLTRIEGTATQEDTEEPSENPRSKRRVSLAYEFDQHSGQRTLTDVKTRQTSEGVFQVGAFGPGQEQFIGTFFEDGTAQVHSTLTDIEGRPIPFQDCTYDVEAENQTSNTLALECSQGRLTGTATVPAPTF